MSTTKDDVRTTKGSSSMSTGVLTPPAPPFEQPVQKKGRTIKEKPSIFNDEMLALIEEAIAEDDAGLTEKFP